MQPLFPNNDDESKAVEEKDGYLLNARKDRTLHPISKDLAQSNNAAAELIRKKLAEIYEEEPSAEKELESEPLVHRSKHQQVMYDLSTSGKPLAQIHTEWHNYYQSLPDHEKHQVWNEFYEANAKHQASFEHHYPQQEPVTERQLPTPSSDVPIYKPTVVEHRLPSMPHSTRPTMHRLRKRVLDRVIVSANTQKKAKQHLHSLAFGISTGLVVLFILLFGLFNEVIIAPFLQPSQHVSATPIIISSDSIATDSTPQVIIPKINVQIPAIYDSNLTNEDTIQKALEQGVIHYATTSVPGQTGNTALFGHSSNNIFNKGQYKFAFVLLHKLVPGDIFYLTYNKTIYTYRVFDKKIVAPSEVSVLNNVPGKTATATLITCDPPGTSNNRLVVWGEQISPDPATSAAPAITPSSDISPSTLSSEGPTFWSRLIHWDF